MNHKTVHDHCRAPEAALVVKADGKQAKVHREEF
jgi:hypothetical protein